VRALDAKPHSAELIFELRDYYWWDAFLRILQLATSIRTISIPLIPLSLAGQAVCHLSALQHVQTFCMSYKDERIGVGETRKTIALSTIQYFMSNWEKLADLDLQGWADENNYKTAPGATSCSFQLVRLILDGETISGSQLLYFVPSTPPTLSTLALFNIESLTNADFTVFLDAVAPSLKDLQFEGCSFAKASSSEELALDATMSKMGSLERAYVDPLTYISTLALSRKNEMDLRLRPTLVVHSYDKSSSSNVVDNIINFFAEGNRTGWREVQVGCNTSTLTQPQPLMDTSIAAAKENDTLLVFV